MRAGPLMLLPMVVACGDTSSPSPSALQLVWLSPRGEVDLESMRRIETLHAAGPEDLAGAGRVEAGWRVLDERGPRQVSLAGEFDLARVDRVGLEVRAAERERLRVGFLRGGVPVVVLDAPELPPGVSALSLEVPPALEGADELRLIFGGESSAAGVRRVTVECQPQPALVPARGAAPVEVGRVTRTARGIFPGRPLAGGVRARAPARLRMTFAVPGGRPARVRVLLDGQEHVRDVPAQAWTSVVLPVTEGVSELELALDPEYPDLALVVAGPVFEAPPQPAPVVLLVTSDTHRADHLGAARLGVDVETPALDALAARGVLFEDARSLTNITNPSHASLFTGVHVGEHGIVDNETRLARAAPTLAEAFASRGWRTVAAVSASHLAPARSGLGQGFEAVAAPAPGESDDFDAVAHLERLLAEVEGRPVLAWLHLFDAHAPYLPRGAWPARYWDAARDPRDPALPRPARRPWWAADVRDLGYLVALYRGEVSALDQRLAPLLARAVAGEWITAFTADHGEHLGVADGFFNHLTLDADNLHVPLLLAGPGVPVDVRCAAPVTNEHLGRTLLDLAGLVSVDFPGSNLLAALDAPPAGPRFAMARYGQSVSVEVDGWLLVRHLTDQTRNPPPLDFAAGSEALFDLRVDPGCAHDRLAEQAARAAALRAALDAFLSRARDRGWAEERGASSAERAELEALGYGGSEDG